MPANSRREAVDVAGKEKDDLLRPVKVRQGIAAMRTIRMIDSRAWGASQGAPFQFVRWLAALTTVLMNWVQSGTPQSVVAYLPVLTVVALLLLPDAASIGVGGLRFERRTSEVGRQKRPADGLGDELSSISNSLVAGSQVSITLGTSTIEAAMATAPPRKDSPRERIDLAAAHLTAEGARLEHELPESEWPRPLVDHRQVRACSPVNYGDQGRIFTDSISEYAKSRSPNHAAAGLVRYTDQPNRNIPASSTLLRSAVPITKVLPSFTRPVSRR
jgi:hypothetical protein